MDQLVGYRPCSFKHDGDAELCPATQPTARRALKLTAGSPRHTAIPHRPTTNGLPFFPYHPPATSPSSAASLNARRLLHSIPIAPPRFRPTAFLPQCSPNRGPALISTLTLGETAERILFVGRLRLFNGERKIMNDNDKIIKLAEILEMKYIGSDFSIDFAITDCDYRG